MTFAIVQLTLFAAVFYVAVAYEPFSQEIIDYVNKQPGATWTAGKNEHFKDFPASSFKHLLGVKRTAEGSARLPSLLPTDVPMATIPDSFDARTAWPHCADVIGEVRDQSHCGSCWAFGAVEAMSDRICIASQGKYKPRLSAEDMLSCCKACGDGCEGGEPQEAWKYFMTAGVATGGSYMEQTGCKPYSMPNCDHHVTGHFKPCGTTLYPTPNCTDHCVKGYCKYYGADKWFGKSAYHIALNVTQIQAEIMQNGPMEADFDVYTDFPSYKSGVYHHTTGTHEGGHAVKVIGWGTDNGTDYWLVVNSWNSDWGLDGLFKIRRGNNECNFEKDMCGGIPELP
jgi:cathepsin B